MVTAPPIVKPTRIGSYYGHCVELCGLYHTFMWARVYVVSKASFATWVAQNGGHDNGGTATLMSALAETHGATSPPARKRAILVPSILSGLVLGLVAAIVAGDRRASDRIAQQHG